MSVRISIFLISIFAASAFAQREMTIAQVQGDKNVSPVDGQSVRVTGIVTARTRTGFFLQTPDSKADTNVLTSEGIFVFTKNEPPADANVGNEVMITGTVDEYRPRNETNSLPITEISLRLNQDTIKLVSKSNVLPKPIALTTVDFMSNTLDQLEKYEGMRVSLPEMTVVAPTGGRVDIKTASAVSDGVFFGVVKGIPRPFREAGLDIRDFLTSPDKEKIKKDVPKLQFFDANPEVIRVDSDEQRVLKTADLGSEAKKLGITAGVQASGWPVNVASKSEIKGLVGVLHYASGKYSFLKDVDNRPTGSTSIKPTPLPAPNERQFSLTGMNLENFFDDVDDPDIKEDFLAPEAFQKRLKKISLAIRDYLQTPDVIGVIEAENLAGLKRLAQKINSDAVAAGKPDPKYDAYLVDGNDGRGIDNGFLVKTARVKVLETKQFGKAEKYKNPNTGEDNFLNDRPPLMIRVAIEDSKTKQPFEFTVVANHLKSFLGYYDPKQMDNVRMKKRLQAEFLAKWIDERQKVNANERIILLGDFNAFQFNDGVMDQIATIIGKPAAKDAVMMSSDDLVSRDMINLVDVIAAPQRYSYVFDGNAQTLDHIIISETLRKHINGFGYARINADFPEILRNDDTRPERFSDHDPAIAFFTFDDVTAPKP